MLRLGVELFLEDVDRFRNERWAILTHSPAVLRNLEYTLLALRKASLDIRILFTPEHGFFPVEQDQIPVSEPYMFEGLKVVSLYGKTKASLYPDEEDVESVDGVIIDIFDVGARYYTYVWTASIVARAFGSKGKKVIVLDRPNPINGTDVEGPVNEITSFVGLYRIPIRHGKTYGEILSMVAEIENFEIIHYRVQGWDRSRFYDELGIPWVMPSPNMPTLDTAIVYPGMCLLEGTNISEGRGTTRPFEIFGAPFIDPFELEVELDYAYLRPIFFKPTFSKYKGEVCGGFQIHVLDRRRFRSVESAVRIIREIKNKYPKEFAWRPPPYEFEENIMPIDLLWGSDGLRRSI